MLWALGETQLLRLHQLKDSNAAHLEFDKRIDLPGPIGYDLQISKTLLPVAPFHNLGGIKSLSFEEDTGQIADTQADPDVWWTYTLRFNAQMSRSTRDR